MVLHINIEELLSARTVESERIEYKKGWNPDAIYRSICAFANDFDNTGGGYILVGVEEDNLTKTAKRPVIGLTTNELAEIQHKMIGFNNLLQPVYHPHLSIEDVDGRQILILWIPGGTNRPYQVPELITAKEKRYFYYIRKYASSVKANTEEQQELISLANQIPFDDRSNTQAKMENISMLLVKDYLVKVKSRLGEQLGKIPDKQLLAQMELISGPDERIFPRNVGLMLFSEHPEKFFPCTQVEIVEFPEGDAAPYIETEPIKGPVVSQITRTLQWLKDKLVKEKVIKPHDKAESIRIASYPYQAIEETLVNAFYHRDYQQREPIEIRIYNNSVVFINHGGPDRSIKLEAFSTGQVRSRRYRNRRLGEFLKELELTEGRATGIATILKQLSNNGSPPPRFNTDDERTFFEVELFIHPVFRSGKPLTVDLDQVKWNLDGINRLLDLLIDGVDARFDSGKAGAQAGAIAETGFQIDNQSVEFMVAPDTAIAGDIVRDIALQIKLIDNQSVAIIESVDRDIAEDIAGGIARGMAERMVRVLQSALSPLERKEMAKAIGLINNVKNFNTYIQPLLTLNWLTMTIPQKPTSPRQRYLTTLKGRLILEFLKHKAK
jgi:ATP-dependent DNA helicase RecG